MMVAEATTVEPAATAPAVAAAAAPPVAVGEPVAGRDYEEIAITPDMAPEDVRKARIANAKAKSAAAKAMKEAGIVVAPAVTPANPQAAPAATAQSPQAVAPAEPTPVTEHRAEAIPTQAASRIPAGIAQPEYIEITADMEPDEVRRARIANAKAKSAFAKALRDAGIDPATIEG
jgi:hypothetical protein